MEILEYIAKQKSDLKELEKLDLACKRKRKYVGRYIAVGFTDRMAFYIVVNETAKKYILRFVLGESVFPEWGHEVRLFKKKVEEIINGRDNVKHFFPKRELK